jgi:hypothetical protein
MLVRTVILPSAFAAISETPSVFYRVVITLLESLAKNGLILIDEQEYIQKFLLAEIDKWPQKYRKEAKVALKRLNEKIALLKCLLRMKVC